MKLKVLLVCLFAAGLGASFALAGNGPGDGPGKGDKGKGPGPKCKNVHVDGTIAAQTLTVTLDKGAKHLNLAAGSQVVLQLGGGTDQTVRVRAEACSTTTGTTTQFVVKSAQLDVKNPPKPHPAPPAATTTAATTTAATTTSH